MQASCDTAYIRGGISVASASAYLGLVHDWTTIEAFETLEFQMRSLRSGTKHREAADLVGFRVVIRQADHSGSANGLPEAGGHHCNRHNARLVSFTHC